MVNRGFDALKAWFDFLNALSLALDERRGRLLIDQSEVDALEKSMTEIEKMIYAIFLKKAREARFHEEITELIGTTLRIIEVKIEVAMSIRISLIDRASLAIKAAQERAEDPA